MQRGATEVEKLFPPSGQMVWFFLFLAATEITVIVE
jgi:hypothetical protein